MKLCSSDNHHTTEFTVFSSCKTKINKASYFLKHLRVYNPMLVHTLFLLLTVYNKKGNNFCKFKLCFSSGVHRDEEARRGARTYDIF